ncbi:MAG: DUF6512 family protein [Aestuariivirga sp.]
MAKRLFPAGPIATWLLQSAADPMSAQGSQGDRANWQSKCCPRFNGCVGDAVVCDHTALREDKREMVGRIWTAELVGILFIAILGSLLHFAFAWSGYWKPAALVAAVNESVWEHLKIAFWPGLVWATIEFAALRPKASQFWSSKGFALLIPSVFIVLIFYAYTSLLGRNLLALDITIFVVAIALGQIGSAKLINARRWKRGSSTLGTGLLVCQLIAFTTFTFYPPPFSIFEDSRNGTRGIPAAIAVPR